MKYMVLGIPDPRGPWTRGLDEVMNMCLAPAVTAADDATGIWFDHFPLVPEEVFSGITDQ